MSHLYKIPGYPLLRIDADHNVYRLSDGKVKCRLKKAKNSGNAEYVNWAAKRLYVSRLVELAKLGVIPGIASGNRRYKLTRTGVLRLLLRHYPDRHVSLTPNKDGVYENTSDLLEMGIQCCPECGLYQPLERNVCGGCGDYLMR